MSLTADRLYQFLPAVIRQRDDAQGRPLQSLLGVVAGQGKVFEDDLARLFDNLFIETCDDWVVPYIGDLLGVRGLNSLNIPGFSQRARVANTLSYRRRKGTATMLQQLARDTTGWPARVVEFFQLLETTQWLNHLRPLNLRTPDLRDSNALELVDSAFDTAAHTADVRHIASGRGRHNIPNIGIFLWRLQSYPLEDSTAFAAPSADGRYFFHSLGLDEPLFNTPKTETDITHLATEIDVPAPLRRRPLFDELEARRAAIAAGKTPHSAYFGPEPILQVKVRLNPGDPIQSIPPAQIFISDLTELSPGGDWRRPDPIGAGNPPNVAVDPVLGRLSFTAGVIPAEVLVSAAHGFPGDLGGGPYDRRSSTAEFLVSPPDWQAGVSAAFTSDPAQNLYATLSEAVDAWNSRPAGTKTGIIAIVDNRTYNESLTNSHQVQLGDGEQLLLVCADWPVIPGQPKRNVGQITPTNRRAVLKGDISVVGTAPAASESPGQFWIDGLWIDGSLSVAATGTANLGTLHLAHTTVVPSAGTVSVDGGNEKLSVVLEYSVTGPIVLPASVTNLSIAATIVHAPGAKAVQAPGAVADIQACTILGEVDVQQLTAGNTLFTDLVKVTRLQTGCVRFCYVPPKSSTPRRYHCQPDLALAGAKTKAAQNLVLARLVPMFTADTFGDPAYLQLARPGPPELATGADNGSEIGVWSFLCQPQRESNLLNSLDEYLRLGLEAGLIFSN